MWLLKSIQQNYRNNKQQKENDAVARAIINRGPKETKNPITGQPYDEPLVDEHPGLDLALMYAQPGSIFTKVIAPVTYKGMVHGFVNGEGAQALITGFAPITDIPVANFEKLVREFPVSGKLNAELWEAAGVDMSKYPKGFTEELAKMQKARKAKLMSGNKDFVVNVPERNRISSYFDRGTSDSKLGYIDVESIGDDLGIRYIEKLGNMTKSELDPYTAIGTDAARQYAAAEGKSLINGRELLNPKVTTQHIDNYFITEPRAQKVITNPETGAHYYEPIAGKYHEHNIKQGAIRQWMEHNPGKVPHDSDIKFWLSENGSAALQDGYINTSSLPRYFDKAGNFRTDLPEELIDELSTVLENTDKIPGFYEQYIKALKHPLAKPNIIRTPFIHPYVYEHPELEHLNLGWFSTFKQGGTLQSVFT